MPTIGAYEFKLSPKAVGGVIDDELGMFPGEWAWKKQVEGQFLAVYACCPDCGLLMTLWQRFGSDVHKGHAIDGAGNISPSVLHSYLYGDPPVEKCGFHTQPTKLLNFVDLRGA
jgi:hypothetical protein